MPTDIGPHVSGNNIGFLWGDLNMASLAAQHRLTSFLAFPGMATVTGKGSYGSVQVSSILDPLSADVNPTSAHVGPLGLIKPGLFQGLSKPC